VDPEYWAAYRRRARARATFQFFLLLGPLFIVGAVLMLVLPIDPNDVRDSPMARQLGAVAFVVVGVVLMVTSVTWLRAHRRG
jgi:drug/metabolite transporter (DMT)-like permease